jgi:hypothetical protein
MHKLHALLAILKRLVREKLSLTLLVGLVAFHLAFSHYSSFLDPFSEFFENFARKFLGWFS